MISTFAVAIPVNAFNPYEQAILDAADRIILGQNNDGGFCWTLPTAGTSYTNLGISAFGVLKAYKLDPRAEFKTSLAMAYMFAVARGPTWSSIGGKWVEDGNYITGGVNSWPDVTFMLELAREAAQDPSLLTEINVFVSVTTVTDIADLAKDRWDDRVDHMGATPPGTTGTATAMAEYLRDFRDVQGLPGMIAWDLEAAVKAALSLEDYYSGAGYGVQADDIVEVIYDSIYGSPQFFDINDPDEFCYVLGLAGALEAFTEAGVYSDEASEIKGLLIGYQKSDGSWQESDSHPQYIVQPTAYAIMALLAQGDVDAQISAALGVEWLIGNQESAGGWLEDNDEYPELNSEAAWALALFNSLLKSNFVPGNGKGLDKPIPNDNFAKGRGPHHGPNENANENAYKHRNGK